MSSISNNQEYSSKILVKRLLREFIKPYYGKLLIAVIFMVVVALTTMLHAWMMKPILDKIFTEKDKALLVIIPVALLGVTLIRGLSTYFQHVYTRNVENSILIDVQRKLFKKLLESDISFMVNYSSGKLISHFTNDVNIMRQSLSQVLTNIIRESLSLILLLALIFYYIPKLALITFCVFPLAIYPVYYLGRKMRKISHRTQKELGVFTNQIDETIQGIKVVKAYNAEKAETKRIYDLTENLKSLNRKAVKTDSLTSPLMEALGGIALAIIIAYGGYEVIEERISTGTFFLFITAVLSAYKPMKSLSKLNNQLQQGLAATGRIFKILDIEPQITNIREDKKLKIKNGSIKFDKVSFTYPNAHEPALSEVSFRLEKGKTYALVGRSGSGKSTIMNLLLRFYDVTNGKIFLDSHDIRDFSFENLRTQLAYVSQDIFLFDDTVEANIAYGSKKKPTKQQIIEAAKKAEAYEFIKELDNGLETKIGPRGTLLSGGQKQRIVLARALLRDTPILLLDEATSALDPISEEKIQKALDKVKKHHTCLIIAHRLETILNADQIMVLDQGKIIATGTHDHLLKTNKFYQHLNMRNSLA